MAAPEKNFLMFECKESNHIMETKYTARFSAGVD